MVTNWYEYHFTNITSKLLLNIKCPDQFKVMMLGYDDLVNLFDKYDIDFYRSMSKELGVSSNSDDILVFVKRERETHSKTNFDGNFIAPVQSHTIILNRNELKEWVTKLRLLTGEPIHITSSILLGCQKEINKMFTEIKSISEVNGSVDLNVGKNLDKINRLIDRIKLPFNEEYIEMARRYFELSYNIGFPGNDFVNAMTAMEILLANKSGINKSLQYNLSILYPDVVRETVSNDIKELYKIRCAIVHEGKYDKANKEKIELLRKYIRRVILTLNDLNISKKDLRVLIRKGKIDALKEASDKFYFV